MHFPLFNHSTASLLFRRPIGAQAPIDRRKRKDVADQLKNGGGRLRRQMVYNGAWLSKKVLSRARTMESSGRVRCEKCSKVTRAKSSHKCTQCDGCKRYYVNLKKHKCLFRNCPSCSENVKITSGHKCKITHSCTKCDFTTRSRQEMREHNKKGHIWTCPECPFQTNASRVMAQHYQNSHKQHQRGYLCPECSMAFWEKKDYQEHLFSHATSEMDVKQSAF